MPSLEFSINPERIGPVLHRLASPTRTQAQIYDRDGYLLLDSRSLTSRSNIMRYDLPPPAQQDPASLWTRIGHGLKRLFGQPGLPLYQDIGVGNGKSYPEVARALSGGTQSIVRVDAEGKTIVSVTAPIQRFRAVRGALLLSTQGDDIDKIIALERWAIVRIFLVSSVRRYRGKDYGYILVPLVVPEKMDFDEFAETTAFRQVAQTITALSTQDERIADEFRAIERGRLSSGKIVEIEGDVPVGMKIKLGDFAAAISTRIWESVGRANWRSFSEAREFAQALGLSSHVEWWKWTTGRLRRANLPEMPPDIPAGPDRVYSENWKDWADWLGHSRRIGGWRPFNEARKYARKLKLEFA